MMPEIPKSARELLARQTAPEVHPSPDLLNAYAEQTLGGAEKDQVMEHLAACSDCREVVFVANQAQEEEVELPLVARVARAQQHMDAMPAAAMPASAQAPKAAELRPAPRRTWWKWAAPLAAVIVLGAAALVERDRMADMFSPPVNQVEMSRMPSTAAPAPSTPPASAAPERQKDEIEARSNEVIVEPTPKKKQAASAEADAKKKYEAELALRDRREMSESLMRSDKASNLEKPRAAASVAAPRGKAVVPPAQSDELPNFAGGVNAPNGGNDLTYIQPQSLAKSALAANSAAGAITNLEMSRRSAAASTHWRISDDGHLEHSVGPSTWTRVLSAEPVVFRVVSTIGSSVWAGGNGGELWHSSDGGQHWNKVALGETGAITTIHFDTAQQGSLTADSGSTWTTSDGGQTWSKQ